MSAGADWKALCSFAVSISWLEQPVAPHAINPPSSISWSNNFFMDGLSYMSRAQCVDSN
jgi:hypothetical protein